jgi:hypothetical protein
VTVEEARTTIESIKHLMLLQGAHPASVQAFDVALWLMKLAPLLDELAETIDYQGATLGNAEAIVDWMKKNPRP